MFGCLRVWRCPHPEIHGSSRRGDYHSPHCGAGQEREGGRERERQGEAIGEGAIAYKSYKGRICVFVYKDTVAKFTLSIHSPHCPPQACDSRDSTSMRLYANLFRWILGQINARIRGAVEKFAFVGILDIFGFENFTVNRFEQFNINFANEKLQEYFNKHIFSLEQHEYSKYG